MSSPKKRSKMWRLIMATPGGPIYTEHRSQPEVYRAVAAEKVSIENELSRVSRISVQKWNPERGDWDLYERVYPER